jgi:hypothetical protein
MNEPRVTESMVRRFCEAQHAAEDGEGLHCDGEYHLGIAAGLRAVLSGKGALCAPRYCECETPTPDPKYHNLCMTPGVWGPNNGCGPKGLCYGFIRGVTEYHGIDGRSKTKGKRKASGPAVEKPQE